MSDDEAKGTPSLEPPSFFGRKKRGKKQAPPAAAAEVESPPAPPARADADIRPELEPVPPPGPPPPGPVVSAPREAASQPAQPVQPVQPAVPQLPKAPRGPWLTGWAAAIVTGLVVGGLIVGGTSASLRLCTAVKGTESCGNAGFPLLLAILVVAVLLGAVLLRAARVPEPGSTSFLAVGLLSVVALLFLIDQLLEWWMTILIPIVSVLTYVLAHWVTTTYIQPAAEDTSDENVPELRDIR